MCSLQKPLFVPGTNISMSLIGDVPCQAPFLQVSMNARHRWTARPNDLGRSASVSGILLLGFSAVRELRNNVWICPGLKLGAQFPLSRQNFICGK